MRFRRVSAGLAALLWAGAAGAAPSFGVVSANTKVRPLDAPALEGSAQLRAARNEFEAFQVVVRSDDGPAQGVSVRLSKPLKGPSSIPEQNVTLYRVGYYQVGASSGPDGAAGPWPDPLIPDVDSYVGEKRNAFPFGIPQGESGAVWVDVLVPQDAVPGDYAGELEVSAGGAILGTLPISLHVGTFVLPSTASLASAFGMGWADACLAHTGTISCTDAYDEDAGNAFRATYLRAALEHRITISDTAFRLPTGESAAHYEKHVLPYLEGTGKSRLPGARLTAVSVGDKYDEVDDWIAFAKSQGFFERLVYHPVVEPADATSWTMLINAAKAAHEADPGMRVIVSNSILYATASGATESADIFAPVINFMDDKPGGEHAGDQRSTYADWEKGKANRSVWAYQWCMSHGCGECGTTTSEPYFSGWPQYVIDSTATQNRCFPWLAFRYELTGELYFSSTLQLTSAWDANGQCGSGASGEGTLFYPGKPSVIGGTKGIPIESIRMKMIREGREDYEYLRLAAAKDAAAAKAIATGLFPHPYECAQPAAKVEKSRGELFAMLDEPDAGSGGAAGNDGGADSGGSAASDAGAPPVGELPGEEDGGCGCRMSSGRGAGALPVLAAALVVLRRRRCRRNGRELPSIE